jgi:predicted dehydrogenase
MDLKLVRRRPVRVGVVGCGVVADYGHIPALSRMEHAELAGFADPDPARREAQARKYGKPAFASFDEMLRGVELDAVSIPTHPALKLDLIRIAAAHGLHAFCEKPLTDTVEQAEELLRLMDGAGLFVGVAFIYRGKETVQRLMQLVREGAIGKLRAVHIENLWDYHGLRSEAWGAHFVGRRRRALRNLGTLDCGVHDLDLARYLAGADFASLSAVGAVVESANAFPDHIILHARMTNGVLVSVAESAVWGYTAKERPPYQQSYRLVGETGVLCARHDSGAKEHADVLEVVSGERQWTETLSGEKAWDEAYRQFLQIILGEDVPHRFLADGHDALVNMRVAREVIRQCQEPSALSPSRERAETSTASPG